MVQLQLVEVGEGIRNSYNICDNDTLKKYFYNLENEEEALDLINDILEDYKNITKSNTA